MGKKLETSLEIWEFLKTNGGLDIKKYDTELINELRKNLKLPSKGNFELQLEKMDIDTEEFILAFFKTVEPFSGMMTDLLCLFEKAEAKSGSKNLLIKFNFNKKLAGLEIDLSHFKELEERIRVIQKKYCSLKVNQNLLWGINSVFRNADELRENKKENKKLAKWVYVYRELQKWPDFKIYPPQSGYNELDKKIKQAWRIWDSIVEKCKAYNESRSVLRYDAWNRNINNDNDLVKLAVLDTDNWPKMFIEGLYCTIEKIQTLKLEERNKFVNNLEKDLDSILKEIKYETYDKEEIIKEFEEFLKLPIWKHRYELYSAWIFTQIVSSLDTLDIEIHSKDGVIDFPFSGAHIGTCKSFSPDIQIWTELKTKFDNPIGKGRKRGIQPDYSLATIPVKNPDSSILVVECKQYFRASSSNFSKAIQDYAKGRPNAIVILVNYGEAKQKILDKVDPLVRDRSIIIGNMKPGSTEAINEFKKQVISSINKSSSIKIKNINKDLIAANLSVPARIELKWGEFPRDLDLILNIKLADGRINPSEFIINYNEKGSELDLPKAIYYNDERDGFGPEIIEIFEWVNGKYTIRVNNFSKEREIAGCGAEVTLKLCDDEKKFFCPEKGKGDCWEVATIDSNGIVQVHNKIVESNSVRI